MMIKYKKIMSFLAGLSSFFVAPEPAKAFFDIEGKTAGPVSIYAQGGLLNYNVPNNPFFMLGIEPKSDGIYVTQGNSLPFNDFLHPSTRTRLLKVTGFGQIQRVGPVIKAGVDAFWGNSLVTGPKNKLYTVTNQGIWGFDPKGGQPERYSQWQGILASAGLTFDKNGERALVSSDYAGLVYVDRNAVEQGPQLVGAVAPTDNPARTAVFDDHFFRSDGLYIVVDSPRSIAKYVGTPNLRIIYNLENDKDVYDVIKGAGYAARGVQDPITGDIFYGLSFDRNLPFLDYYIVRIKRDFSDASIFATGMEQIRDMKFGPSSSKYGKMTSLYVAVNDRKTFQGTIYEIPMGKASNSKKMMSASLKNATSQASAVPEPTTMIGMTMAFAFLFKRKKSVAK